MRFDELYTLALEAAKNFGSPKNIGGSRLQNVKQSEGPSGYASSSVGKSDNFQERVPIDQKNKKGFDPNAQARQRYANIEAEDLDTGESITRKKTAAEKINVKQLINNEKKSLFNAFSLLNNSDYFKTEMPKIQEEFGGSIVQIKISDETKLKNLRFQVAKNRGVEETLRDEIAQYQEVLDNYNAPEDEKVQTEIELESDKALYKQLINNIKKKKGGSKLYKLITDLETENRRKRQVMKMIGSKSGTLELQKINSKIYELKNTIEEIGLEDPSLKQYTDRLFNVEDSINNLTHLNWQHRLGEKDIVGSSRMIGDKKVETSKGISKILSDKKDKLAKVRETLAEDTKNLEAIENHVSKVSTHNERANDNAIAKFVETVKFSAKQILDEKFPKFDPQSQEASEIDWESELPNRGAIYNMLNSLLTDDNPIIDFIDALDRPYLDEMESEGETRGAVRHNVDKAMSDNENITVIIDFENLPFHEISKYYNTVKISTMPMNNLAVNDSFRAAYRQFYKIIQRYSGEKVMWDSEPLKIKLKQLLGIDTGSEGKIKTTHNMGEVLKDVNKLNYEKLIDSEYKKSASGADSFKQLLSMVDSDLKGAFPRNFMSMRSKLISGEAITESFDELAAAYASSFNFDLNDFHIDLQEVKVLMEKSKKCTGPTKKASSDRKGKKWTKCAKQPDGSYKRIHWGEAGVRVTGKSGNTKRKKSFKARHNCSNAKKGSAQAAACSDWK